MGEPNKCTQIQICVDPFLVCQWAFPDRGPSGPNKIHHVIDFQPLVVAGWGRSLQVSSCNLAIAREVKIALKKFAVVNRLVKNAPCKAGWYERLVAC